MPFLGTNSTSTLTCVTNGFSEPCPAIPCHADIHTDLHCIEEGLEASTMNNNTGKSLELGKGEQELLADAHFIGHF